MKILVTGGTGYLGSHLIRRFLENGHLILCLKLANDPLDHLGAAASRIEFADATDPQLEERIANFSPETVVHTACAYERGNNRYPMVFDANLQFPFRVLNACLGCGLQRWLNTATSLPPALNSYSLSKYQFSEWGKFFAEKKGLTFLNLQLEHFYGPHGPQTHFLSWVLDKLKRNEPLELTAGTQKRDFVYLEDVVKIFDAMLHIPAEGYLDVPVGTGETPCIREVVEYLHRLCGSSSPLHFGAVPMRENEPSSRCDTTVLNRLGLHCQYGWKDGMKKLVEEEMGL